MPTNEFIKFKASVPDTHYATPYRCPNCGHSNFLTIPKGQSIYEFVKGKSTCEYCKCNMEDWLI